MSEFDPLRTLATGGSGAVGLTTARIWYRLITSGFDTDVLPTVINSTSLAEEIDDGIFSSPGLG
jgi:hypothetical protein